MIPRLPVKHVFAVEVMDIRSFADLKSDAAFLG